MVKKIAYFKQSDTCDFVLCWDFKNLNVVYTILSKYRENDSTEGKYQDENENETKSINRCEHLFIK